MCHIIIVDDKDLSLELIYSFLIREGYQHVKKFDSPLNALHEVKNGFSPDLVITDYRMPQMNGIQFLYSLYDQINRKIPSIILTGDPGSLPAIPEKITILEKGRVEFFKELLDEVYKICSLLGNSDYDKIYPLKKTSVSQKRTVYRKKEVAHFT
jgi:CheY-like chemotaxis protein